MQIKIQDARYRIKNGRYEMHGISSLESCISCLDSTPFFSFPTFQNSKLAIASISTRIGGISHNPYKSLNLAYHVGDIQDDVTENRKRFCHALGINMDSLVIAQQIHGDKVAVVDKSHAGAGAYSHESAIFGADAMITNTRYLALGVLTADCVPVLILDPIKKVIGVAHAGWRGILKMIAAKAVLMMQETFRTRADDCLVALGPSIGPCCYVVDENIISQFKGFFGQENCIVNDRLHLQLATKKQLMDTGVKENNIIHLDLCTACNLELFFSYRGEGGITGRMMSVLSLIYD
ncbi:peptidoglycan editing factor PgeF [Candidatus Poribacteria bacterium]|nr:peptidoglycan editing factor PgeF [Candidatus Poribacteria bacterium]